MAFLDNEPAQETSDMDHESAAALLSPHLQGASPSGLAPFGSGDFCLAFKMEEQIIRVARHLEAAAALRRETCVLAVIGEELPLPVPRPTYHSPPDGPAFTVHQAVIGETLTREIGENLPSGKRERAVADLAHFLKVLHSIPVETVQACALPHLDAAAFAGTLCEASRHSIHELLDPSTRHRLDATLEKWSITVQPDGQRASLLHCDIGPGHVFYDPYTGHLTGVIDFGDLAIGPPARDFIYIYEDFGPALLAEVLNRYAGENAARMMLEIRKWYLLEALSWTLRRYREKQETDLQHGLAEIRRELAAAPL